MVLGYLLKGSCEMKPLSRLFYSALISAGLTYQPALADSHAVETHDISTFTLSLNNDSAQCILTANKSEEPEQQITLLLDTPCYWVSAENTQSTEPLHYSYPELEVDSILLVAGGELEWTEEKKTYHKLPLEKVCSQYLQGIIISGNEIFAVDEAMDAPHCDGLVVDEKVFRQAVNTKERYQEKSTNTVEASVTLDKELEATTVETTPDKLKSSESVEDNSLFGSIQKTIKRLFTSED